MHNGYIHDLFTEGLGDIFFMKIYNLINKKIKNNKIKKLLIRIYAFIYIVFLIAVAYIIFKLSFPL